MLTVPASPHVPTRPVSTPQKAETKPHASETGEAKPAEETFQDALERTAEKPVRSYKAHGKSPDGKTSDLAKPGDEQSKCKPAAGNAASTSSATALLLDNAAAKTAGEPADATSDGESPVLAETEGASAAAGDASATPTVPVTPAVTPPAATPPAEAPAETHVPPGQERRADAMAATIERLTAKFAQPEEGQAAKPFGALNLPEFAVGPGMADGVMPSGLAAQAARQWQEAAAPASPAAAASTPAQSTATPVPLRDLPMVIAAQADGEQRHFKIRLDPVELGSVDVSLSISKDGTVRTHIVVERAATLFQLTQDAPKLEQAFQSQANGGSFNLSFSLRQDGQGQQEGRASFGGGSDAEAGDAPSAQPSLLRPLHAHALHRLDLTI